MNRTKKKNFTLLFLLLFPLIHNTLIAAENSPRIISLVPSITRNLIYLGSESDLVGRTSYCILNRTDVPVVASAVKPNLEKIVTLKPDVVLVSGLTSPKDIETLRKLNIRVEEFRTAQSFNDIVEQYITLGRICGKEETAKEQMKNIINEVEAIRDKQSKRSFHPKVFMQLSSRPLFAVIQKTFLNDCIALAGGVNIAGELTKGTIASEFVVASQPDIIVITTMGAQDEQQRRDWLRFGELPAVKNEQVVLVDSNIACQPTPFTFLETLKFLTQLINK